MSDKPVRDVITAAEQERFFVELQALCDKYRIYVSHEDGHGSFLLSRDPNTHSLDGGCVEDKFSPNACDECLDACFHKRACSHAVENGRWCDANRVRK